MDAIQTPESNFDGLIDYPFAPNFMDVGGLRMHYLDEGDASAPVVFLLHGQPTWSYLYRNMIPAIVDAGYRVIAPDLIGFGKSDKPRRREDHSYGAHVVWLGRLVDGLGITGAAAFMQDWGGMIGLRVLARKPQWLSRLVLANTVLAKAGGLERLVAPTLFSAFLKLSPKIGIDGLEAKVNPRNWMGYFRHAQSLELGRIVQALTTRRLSEAEMRGYDAPFLQPGSDAGPLTLPSLVLAELDQINREWDSLRKWTHPVLTLFSDKDPFLAKSPYAAMFQERFPGAAGQPHQVTRDASHFLQEDQSGFLGETMLGWLGETGFVPGRQSALVSATGLSGT